MNIMVNTDISDASDTLGMDLQSMLLVLYLNDTNVLFTYTGFHTITQTSYVCVQNQRTAGVYCPQYLQYSDISSSR
jgi:hypothetical protein